MATAGIQCCRQFEIVDRIGEGGYGCVFLVKHFRLGEVVLKKLRDTNDILPRDLIYLRHEANILKKLRHKHIVILYEGQFDSNFCGLFLEHVKYGPVDGFLKLFNVSKDWKLQIIFDISLAMCYLHDKGIIHGDLKCKNILIGMDFHVKVCDFGLSQIHTVSESDTSKMIAGSVKYVAPEYLQNPHKKPTQKFDVYSYAISVWEIVSGKYAYYDYGLPNLVPKFVCDGERPSINDIKERINEIVAKIVQDCWQPQDKMRPTFLSIRDSLQAEINLNEDGIEESRKKLMEQQHQNSQQPGKNKLSSIKVEKRDRTLVLKDVTEDMIETVSHKLEILTKGIGNIELKEFDEKHKTLTVCFDGEEVVECMMKRSSLNVLGKEIIFSKSTCSSSVTFAERNLDISEENDEHCRSVVVKNVTEEIEEDISFCLENSRKGGGKIESKYFDEMSETLRICFCDKTVAKKLLSMGSINFLKKTYEICSPTAKVPTVVNKESAKELEQRKRSLQILEVTPDSKQLVLNLLQSPLISGGFIESHRYEEKDKSLTILFQHKNVVHSLMKQGSLKIQDKEFIFSIPTFPSNSLKTVKEKDEELSEDEELWNRTVIIKNVKTEMKDTVTVFLENPRKGGGDIECEEFDEKIGTLTIRFVEKETARKLLSMGTVNILKKTFEICSPTAEVPTVVNEESEEKLKQGERSIQILAVTPDSKQLVLNLLQSTMISGGSVESYKYEEKDKSLTILFEDKKVVHSLMKQGSLKIQDKEFIFSIPTFPSNSLETVKEMDEELSEDEELWNRTVIIKNVKTEMKDTVTVFLENPRKGGGDIECEEFDEQIGTLTIRFVEKEIAKNLLSMGTIIILKNTFEICSPTAGNEESAKELEQREVTPDSKQLVLDLLESSEISRESIESHTYEKEEKSSTVPSQHEEEILCMDPDSSPKTVVFEDVPPENYIYLWMFLNNGNQNLECFKAEVESKSVLVTFVDKDVVHTLMKQGSWNIQGKEFIFNCPIFPSNLLITVDKKDKELLEEKEKWNQTVPINAMETEIQEIASKGVGEVEYEKFDETIEAFSNGFIKEECNSTTDDKVDQSDAGKCTSNDLSPLNDAVMEEKMLSLELNLLNRSIKVKNASTDIESELYMLLETKKYGGGWISYAVNNPYNGEYLVIFKEPEIASRYINKGHIKFNYRLMEVVKPELSELHIDLSSSSDSSTEGCYKNENVDDIERYSKSPSRHFNDDIVDCEDSVSVLYSCFGDNKRFRHEENKKVPAISNQESDELANHVYKMELELNLETSTIRSKTVSATGIPARVEESAKMYRELLEMYLESLKQKEKVAKENARTSRICSDPVDEKELMVFQQAGDLVAFEDEDKSPELLHFDQEEEHVYRPSLRRNPVDKLAKTESWFANVAQDVAKNVMEDWCIRISQMRGQILLDELLKEFESKHPDIGFTGELMIRACVRMKEIATDSSLPVKDRSAQKGRTSQFAIPPFRKKANTGRRCMDLSFRHLTPGRNLGIQNSRSTTLVKSDVAIKSDEAVKSNSMESLHLQEIIPNSWDQMAKNETLKSVPLNPSDKEYKTVEANVMSSHGNTVNQIVKIERIQNITLYKQYVTRKTAMDNANPNVANERTLWHGTAADVVASINATGYNQSYCGKNATVYGRGVYFAKTFNYSAQQIYSPPDANGIKHIYQSKVLVGEFTLGSQTYMVPPLRASSTSAKDKYNSVVDNVANPSVFVIFYENQAYPEYLIYFK